MTVKLVGRLAAIRVISGFGLAAAGGLPVMAQPIAIRAGAVVDPALGKASGPQVIVIEGGRIISVGSAVPANASVIDLSSWTVSPGLFDAHTHLTAAYDPTLTRLREYTVTVSTAERALEGVVNAWQMLESGFTTVRDLGNAGNYADAALAAFFGSGDPRRRAVYGGATLASLKLLGGRAAGPTIVFAGKIISPFGGQFQLSPEQTDLGRQDYLYADTRDQLKEAVRQNLHFGATWIKLTVDDYPYKYTADDLRFVVEEATRAGARVTAHVVTEAGARAAIEAGVASIEHGYEMSDSTLSLAKARRVVLVGTEPAGLFMAKFGRSDQDGRIIDRLRRAYRIGTPLAFGADIVRAPPGVSRGEASLSVIASWIEAGVPPPEILRAMTTSAAELLGMEKQRGTIKPGYAADLIATRGNPLTDIKALEQVGFVMKDGLVFKSPGTQ